MDNRTAILRTVKLFFEPLFHASGLRRSSPKLSLSDARSIVIVNTHPGIGDLVVMTAFLREIRLAMPETFITCIVVDRFGNLLEHCPYINELVTVPWPARITAQWLIRCNWRLNDLRMKRRFEVAIVLPSNNCEITAYLTGAVQRLGYGNSEAWHDQFLTTRLQGPVISHEVEKLLLLLKRVGIEPQSDKIEIWLSDDEERFADQVFSKANLTSKLVIAIAPGASGYFKQWPAERFGEISRWLVERMDASIIVVGGKPDAAWGDDLVNAIGARVLNLAGKTTTLQAAAVLKRCALYVGNDTGPKHLAAAVQTPVVEISCVPVGAEALYWMGPEQWHAWGVAHRVVRPSQSLANGKSPCIEAVSVAMVKAAILEIISSSPRVDSARKSSADLFAESSRLREAER